MAKEEKKKDIDEKELGGLDSILRGVNFLAQFNLSALEKLLCCLKKVSFKKGETVVREGDIGDSFYFISKGKVGIWVKKGLGKSRIKKLSQGEYFGEMALLVGGKRNATVIVEEDADFFILSKQDFRSMLLENPTLMDMVIRTSEVRRAELVMEREK
ncbi:hypothetical protein COS16_05765 [Candidatus Desantisbacteria bacterium CG02_land_8_20_14_3_00_49_13]|nr:MAG: hypothetical protein AUJ67_10255 [Candidatus Desantisbacteria bacterium CG1_02_49_89]PIV55824.1 MAG: hypothetical protein COS16_05765 [Candidatus Desantisbacteria bacterium CG02_land_8_20_14_3_00_49_13]